MSALSITSLGVEKDGRKILEGLGLEVPRGKVTALIGPNGAGKSTLFRAIAGLEKHVTGRILLNGQDVLVMSAAQRARALSWVPDGGGVPFPYTVTETVLLGRYPWHQGQPGKEDRDRVQNALEQLRIGAFAKRKVTTLSAGELHKVMIARALAGDSGLLLLDEPFANLDIAGTLELCLTLRDLAAKSRSVVLTVHDVTLADRFADHVICISKGKLAASGSAREVLTPKTMHGVFGIQMDELHDSAGQRVLRFRL